MALHTITSWALGLVPNYVLLVLSNEGGVLITCKVVIHGTCGLDKGS